MGHILRAAACAARIAEIDAPGDTGAARLALEQARQRAAPEVVAVLVRYPRPRAGRDRVAALMSDLDAALRPLR